jgi:hypothetical protein
MYLVRYSALAQLVEQLTVNQFVAGSSPASGDKKPLVPCGLTVFFVWVLDLKGY